MQTPALFGNIPASSVLGVRVHHVTMAQAVQAVGHMLEVGGEHQVVTANGVTLVRAARETPLRKVLNGASLTVADGVGVTLAARILGRPALQRVPGVDLAQGLCARAAAEGWRIFLFGAAPGIAAVAAERLRQRYPGLQIAGVVDGYTTDYSNVIARIREARPQLLFVALGFPRQELWIAEHRGRLGVPVAIGVGGTLDVLAGELRRAPRWMQRLGLEWAYRVWQEPRRWRIAVGLPLLLALAVKERIKEQGKRRQNSGY